MGSDKSHFSDMKLIPLIQSKNNGNEFAHDGDNVDANKW